MKKYLLFFLIGFLLLENKVSEAQYCKLIDTNKLWNYYDVSFDPPPHYTYLYRFNSDTIIGGKKYLIPEYSNDSINWHKQNFYLREEDSSQRVYVLSDNNEGLLYDFSLTTGDSITINNTLYGFNMPRTVNVDSIDSIQIGNSYRKVMFLDEYTWIEGIGDLMGLYNPGLFVSGFGLNLICYYENDSLAWVNPHYGSCFHSFLNVVENNKGNQLLIKTIDNNYFIISSKETIEEIILINILGEQIAHIYQSSNQFLIDLSEMSTSIYFLKCKINNKLYTLKIIKI